MEQRRLRVGDILDDYCPRERRVTNHAIVAMIDGEIRQTRCTTCEAEHAYRAAKVPPRRKKALLDQVLEGGPRKAPGQEPVVEAPPAPVEEEPAAVEEPSAPADARAAAPETEAPEDGVPPVEEGPVHRRLIRATLPRVEGQPARPTPDFTIRRVVGRNGNFQDVDRRGLAKGKRGKHRAGGQAPGGFPSPRSAKPARSTGSSRGFTPHHGQRPMGGPHPPRSRHGKKRSK